MKLVRAWRRALLLVCMLALTGCRTELYSKLDEQEANRMMAVLAHHGVDASKKPIKGDSFALQIARADFGRAMDALDAAGLPGQQHLSLKDVFQGGGLVATPTQERAQLMYAIGGELARTLSTIDGILDARVHVVLPESDPLRRQIVPSSAAVFVRHAPDVQINPLLPQIKKLVADSVAGLVYERVSVTAVAAVNVSDQARDARNAPRVLGIEVSPSSRSLAISLFSFLCVAVLLLGIALAFVLLRARRSRQFQISFGEKEDIHDDHDDRAATKNQPPPDPAGVVRGV